jgi:tetratricopeptide (TPR) repeat protein
MRRIQFYSFITIVLFCVSCASNAATEQISAPLSEAEIRENLVKADELAKSRNDVAKVREAVKLLAKSRNFDNPNFEVEWKFAKFNYFLGKAATEKDEIEKALKTGETAGKTASRIAPDKPEGYFWYAVNLGEQAKRSPVTVGIAAVDKIREAMTKVIEIQPDFQTGSAFDALGQLELETRMTSGTAEKAVEYLEKGLQYGKENSYIRLHLAQAYLAVKRTNEAKKQLEYVLKIKPNPDFLPEHEEALKEAKKLLETRF